MQLATLTVLASTLSVVAFVLMFSLNLKRVLASWGEGVQVSVYLKEETSDEQIAALKEKLSVLPETKSINFVAKEAATANFKSQMASYAPGLLGDSEFANPFPASYKLTLNEKIESDKDVDKLEALAGVIGKMEGVEDVSYGQSWVRNYSSFVSALHYASAVMAAILLAGGIFVVGNSIRTSISARREEIQILELVGATSNMIRRPFVTEGLIMGAIASAFALSLNLVLHYWQKSVMAKSLVLSRIVPLVSFLDLFTVIAFLVIGAGLGALGAWLTVRKINDGWSASQGLDT